MDPELLAYFDQHFSSLNQRFDRVDQRLDRVEQRLDGVGQRLDGVDQRLDRVDQRLDGIDQRFDRVDRRFDGIDQRLDNLETGVRHAHVLIEDLRGKVQLVAESVEGVRDQLKAHEAGVNTRFDKVEKRLLTIEAYAHASYEDLNSRIPKRKRQPSDRTGL
jgi:archaellum component FlaC